MAGLADLLSLMTWKDRKRLKNKKHSQKPGYLDHATEKEKECSSKILKQSKTFFFITAIAALN